MITLHRLGHQEETFQLNPDLIVSIEATPDTVITLATSTKVVVADSPDEIAEAVREWRAQVLQAALENAEGQQELARPLAGVGGLRLVSGRGARH